MDTTLTVSDLPRVHRSLKRGIDIFGALVLVACFAPLIIVIAIAVSLDTRGGILFRQKRIGKDGRPFDLLKFRTMRLGADEGFQEFLNQNPGLRLEYAQFQKLAHDPRLTAFGSLLRRFSMDELPQLWNVLRGEMSLVGPRPFLPEQAAMYGPGLWRTLQARPGITGLWQVSGRNLLSFQERAACDARYLRTWTIWLDLAILLRTPWVVIRSKGAY